MKITLLSGKTFDFSKALGFNIKIIKSTIARRLNLRIDEKQHLPVLTIPRFCSNKKALAFVEANREWIQNMLAKLPPTETFHDGSQVSIGGIIYTIKHQTNQRGVTLANGILTLGGEKDFLHRRVCDFLKKYASDYLFKLSVAAAEKIGCRIHKVTIKETKSRWGSCSSKKNINYNWRIIMAPDYVIDYLVCHEVSHLSHQDHSQAFWECVAFLCPDYKRGRHWLKIHGKELYRWL